MMMMMMMMMRMRMNHPLDFFWVAPTISLLATLGLSEVRRVPCSGNTAPSSADADRVKLRVAGPQENGSKLDDGP